MPYLLNVLYLSALFFLSPWLAYKVLTTGKYRRGLWQKLAGPADWRAGSRQRPEQCRPGAPVCWFHGVSVGEIHLLRQVAARFRQRHPDWDCVLTTTTDTGFEEAKKAFPDLAICFWPFDFSWAVRRALRVINPSLIVLAEAEMWPNFLLAARWRRVPVAVINGRMSPRSLRHYQMTHGLARFLFRGVDLFAVQTEDYAAAFRALGVAPERVHITGSVKFDGVTADRHNARTASFRELFRIEPGDLVWVVGSTQAPEEEIALTIYQRLRQTQPNLRLILVPRQKERFDEVAGLLRQSGTPAVRRSALSPHHPNTSSPRHPVILLDTIGELSAVWGLADVAFVGGSLDGKRGGQNMIEPAAYGAAVVFGPHVWNFRDTAARLVQAGAAVQVGGADELHAVMTRLSGDAAERQQMGDAARQFVRQQQGATERTMDLLDALLFQKTQATAA